MAVVKTWNLFIRQCLALYSYDSFSKHFQYRYKPRIVFFHRRYFAVGTIVLILKVLFKLFVTLLHNENDKDPEICHLD